MRASARRLKTQQLPLAIIKLRICWWIDKRAYRQAGAGPSLGEISCQFHYTTRWLFKVPLCIFSGDARWSHVSVHPISRIVGGLIERHIPLAHWKASLIITWATICVVISSHIYERSFSGSKSRFSDSSLSESYQ